jgi:DNA-binding response OmpR family regulator
MVLSKYGYEVFVAYGPAAAIQLANRIRFTFLIADVMPQDEMSGIEIAIAIRKMLPPCKVLLISG